MARPAEKLAPSKAEHLLNMDDDEFRQAVDQEVRGTLPTEVSLALRDPRLSQRWYLALIQMKKSVESQLGAKRSDLVNMRETDNGRWDQELANFHRWRAGAVRFKSGVEERLIEIRRSRLVVFPTEEVLTEQRNWALEKMQCLVKGIVEHQRTVSQEYDEDVSDADKKLWKLVDLPGVG